MAYKKLFYQFLLICLTAIFSACDKQEEVPTDRTEFRVSPIGLVFTYDAEDFDIPQYRGNYILNIYEKGKIATSNSPIDLRYTPPNFVPDYGGWYSDMVGTIASESSLHEVCGNSKLEDAIIFDCKIIDEPMPHIEFYIAGTWADITKHFGLLHKAAVVYTGDPELPGIFISGMNSRIG